MDPERVLATHPRHRRTIHLTIRVSPEIRHWLREKRFSATKIFYEAIKELGYRHGNRIQR